MTADRPARGSHVPSDVPSHWWRGRTFETRGLFVGVVIGVVVTLLAATLDGVIGGSDELEPGAIVVLSGRDDSAGGQRQRLIREWNALHDANPATIVELSPIADAQHTEMLARAQSDGAGVDVFNLDVTWTAEFADAGHLQSLDESRIRPGEFREGPLSTCRYDGRLWALPFNTDVGLLYYNNDLLTRIGRKDDPPRSWEDLADDVDKVRAQPGNEDVHGYLGQLANYEGLTVTALEMVWGAGGTVVDDDGRVLPDPGDAQAVQAGLDRLGDVAPNAAGDLPALNEDDSLRQFIDGKALFMRNWPVAYQKLTQARQEGAAPDFGVTALPGASGALGGQNLAVSARSARPRAARALIEFLTNDRSQQLLFARGGLPATRAVVYQNPRDERPPIADTLDGALSGARRRPSVPHYAEFSAAFRTAADGYLRTKDPLDDNALRADLEAALKGRLPPVGGN